MIRESERKRLVELVKQGDKAFADKYTGKPMLLVDEIEDAPTADVVEVKHSRWENISGFDVCNICGTSPAYCEPKPNNPKGYPPYCHNCGAKMDGK